MAAQPNRAVIIVAGMCFVGAAAVGKVAIDAIFESRAELKARGPAPPAPKKPSSTGEDILRIAMVALAARAVWLHGIEALWNLETFVGD